MARTVNNIIRTLSRLVVFAITGLTFLCAVAVLLTQLDAFRSWALQQGLDALNSELQGKIEIGSVSGNLITGLTIHDVRLKADSTTLLSAPEVKLRYSLPPIFRNQTVHAEAIVYRPTIRLIRNRRDSTWNFAHITKPSTDSIKTPFNWTIDIPTFELRDASFVLTDLTAEPATDTLARTVDYSRLELDDLNLSVQAFVSPTRQSIWIQNMAFDVPRPDIRVIELSGRIGIDTTGLSVDDLYLETERTLLTMSAHLDSVNVMGDEPMTDFGSYPMSLDMRADRVSMLELQRFVPSLTFLGGTPSLSLTASGDFNDLRVDTARLRLVNSDLNFSGRLQHLANPAELRIDALVGNSTLSNKDADIYVPGLELPDLDYVGTAVIRSASFSGPPDNFSATIDASTDIGTVNGGILLDLRQKAMQYVADVAVVHGNLAPVMKDSAYRSDFTGRLVINGKGVGLDELDAQVRLESQGSSFAGRSYRKLYLDATASRGGVVTVDTLLIAWGSGTPAVDAPTPAETLPDFLSRNVRTILASPLHLSEEDRRIFAAGPSIGIGGVFDMRQADFPSYRFSATGRRVDLQEITLDPAQRSNLSFTIGMEGSGLDPDRIVGTGYFDLTDGEYGGSTLPPITATFGLKQGEGERRSLDLESNIADVDLQGKWRFSTILPGILDAVNGFTGYVQRKAQNSMAPPEPTASTTSLTESIDARYDVTIKDLAPLQPLLNGARLAAAGTFNGRVYGTPSRLNIASSGRIDLLFGPDTAALRLTNTDFTFNITDISPQNTSDAMSGLVYVKSDTSVRYGDMTFDKPDVKIDFAHGLFHLVAKSFINTTMFVAVDGNLNANDPAGYGVSIDTLFLNLGRNLEWRNVGQIRATVSSDEIRIDTLSLKRRRAEVVTVTGSMVGSELKNVDVSITQGSLKGIGRLFEESESYTTVQPMQGRIRQADLHLEGSLEDPAIDAIIALDSLSYSGNYIGNLRTQLAYRAKNLEGTIRVENLLGTTDTTQLPANIRIDALPIDLALASRAERLVDGGPVKISVATKNLPIAFAGPFIPNVKVRKGRADIDFNIEGNYPNLSYHGQGLVEAQATLDANNIMYYIRLPLRFQDELLTIENAVLKNDPRELPGGTATVDARIRFDGLTISHIDVTARSPKLLVLSNASEAVNQVVYGKLIISTGARPIEFSGSLQSPTLSGDVIVEDGDLTLPTGNEYRSSTGQVRYISREEWVAMNNVEYGPVIPTGDTMATEPEPESDSASLAGASAQAGRMLGEAGAPVVAESSILDRLDLDLLIDIRGRLFVLMDLGGPAQQLRAEIGDGGIPLTIRRENGVMEIVGTLEAKAGSKFIFIKTFDASGTISFQNDISNPTIDIDAQYKDSRVKANSNETEPYTVDIKLTGTKERPNIAFSYTIDGVEQATGDPDRQRLNAVSMLLTKHTTEELGGRGKLNQTTTDVLGSFAGAYTSALTSALLSSALGSSSFIQSVGVDVGEFNGVRVNLVSQLGPVVLRYNGAISAPSDGTITVDLPLTALADADFFKSFALQLERAVEDARTSTTAGSEKETYRLRLQFRDSW